MGESIDFLWNFMLDILLPACRAFVVAGCSIGEGYFFHASSIRGIWFMPDRFFSMACVLSFPSTLFAKESVSTTLVIRLPLWNFTTTRYFLPLLKSFPHTLQRLFWSFVLDLQTEQCRLIAILASFRVCK